MGRIVEGYRADLVIFDALSPAMVSAAQRDPIAAVILHSGPADIETVVIDGIVQKRDGKLMPTSLNEHTREIVGEDMLEWSCIARNVVESRHKMQEEVVKIDFEEALDSLLNLWHIHKSKLTAF